MKYLSLFSGIGGFELALQNIIPEAECIGFSEVDKFALQVYQHHFPDHQNLGDVTAITEEIISELVERHKGCDLLVGGFPCKNLTSLARHNPSGNSDGLDGPMSGLFWDMIQIMKWLVKYNSKYGVELNFIIENNGSMKKCYQHQILDTLIAIDDRTLVTKLDGYEFGVQRRSRFYWTTFEVNSDTIACVQTWDDVLEPVMSCDMLDDSSKVVMNTMNNKSGDSKRCVLQVRYCGNKLWEWFETDIKGLSRWQKCFHSETRNSKCRTITSGNMNFLLEYVTDTKFHIRRFQPVELERLFFFEDGWVSSHVSRTRCKKLLANTVIVKVIEFIILNLIKYVKSK